MVKLNQLLNKYEKFIPVVLFIIFFLITAPGTSWGLPTRLHPHEVIKVVFKALFGDWQFDTKIFVYTSLPKYVMFWMGKIILWLGYSQQAIYLSARLFSVLLGASIVSITYRLTRLAGGSIYLGLLASFLVISNSQMAQDSRFAHNDIYLTFFVCLTAFTLVKYFITGRRTLLYLAFFECGLAVSSKQNGIGLVFATIVLVLIIEWNILRKDILRAVETFFIGIVLTVLGFGIGTPKALTWAAFYFKRMAATIKLYQTYTIYPGDKIGIFEQWKSLDLALGKPVYILCILAFITLFIKVGIHLFRKTEEKGNHIKALLVLLMFILVIDLPLLVVYEDRPRYFLPLVPLVSVLISFFIQELINFAGDRKIKYATQSIIAATFLIITFSMLRVVSIGLLFFNDSRMAASKYLKTLPPKSSIEYTRYPPPIDKEIFTNANPYPIHFIKWEWEEEVLPSIDPALNTGEAGIEERQPEYLIFDSFTYARFSDDRVCERHLVECEFYNRLIAGETNYELVASFEYDLPWYIPEVKSYFLNPDILIFQRVSAD